MKFRHLGNVKIPKDFTLPNGVKVETASKRVMLGMTWKFHGRQLLKLPMNDYPIT